jgi:hypothetical protein
VGASESCLSGAVPASITSFLCNFFRDSSFASQKVPLTGFYSAKSDNTIIRDHTSWN